jgi:D-beta-D-heptose 7-phosphate kinase/D-beta-D-heptose 1-phosphate adenosyltransferase
VNIPEASTSNKPLVVVGDSLLDIDIEGTADRLCPEAPVPVVDVGAQWHRPGGAGLAALLAGRTVREVVLVTALGNDAAGHCLHDLLRSEIRVVPLTLSGDTVCKTRVRASGASVVRLDAGDGRADEEAAAPDLHELFDSAGAILVADYGRGVTEHPEVRAHLTAAAQHVPLVWDPHPRGADPVCGATLVTPNRAEAVRFAPGHWGESERAARLALRWEARAVSITLGADGAVVAETGRPPVSVQVPPSARIPSSLRPDTCGAGDRFAGAAAAALHAGESIERSVEVAVESAARFVAAGGAAAVSTCASSAEHAGPTHVDTAADTWDIVDRVRRSGGRIVATGGCFDLLHRGHVSLLRQARAHGDALVVCLNSDESVRRAKGSGRPLVEAADRAQMLRELSYVDAVVVFDEDTPTRILDELRPDVWVKGSDYANRTLPESATVERYGGSIVFVPVTPGYSTTRIVRAATGA